jgi:hypothetical protein
MKFHRDQRVGERKRDGDKENKGDMKTVKPREEKKIMKTLEVSVELYFSVVISMLKERR